MELKWTAEKEINLAEKLDHAARIFNRNRYFLQFSGPLFCDQLFFIAVWFFSSRKLTTIEFMIQARKRPLLSLDCPNIVW